MEQFSAWIRFAARAAALVLVIAGEAWAEPTFPQFLNDWCTSQNRIPAQPIPTTFPASCETCHRPGTFDKVNVVLPAWAQMDQENYAWFCPLLANANNPPVLAPVGNRAVGEGNELTIPLSATDVDGDVLSFSASDLPPGASLVDGGNGTASFSWTPGFQQAGTFSVTFIVQDDAAQPASDSEQITITVGNVNRPPVLAPIGSHAVDEAATLAFSVTATDPDGDRLVFAGASLPTGSSLTDRGNGTADFAWTPGFERAGNYTVTATVSDGGNPIASDSETFTITVGDVNRPPVLMSVGNRDVSAGQPLQISLSAADPDGGALHFAAAGLPAGASFNDGGNGSAEFAWTPGFDQSGNFTVSFSVTDSGQPMASDSEQIVITVGGVNRPPALGSIGSRSVEAEQLLSIALTATDPDGDALSFSVSGLPPGAQLLDHQNGSAEFSWTPGSDQNGNHSLTFMVSDSGTPSASDSEEITVSVGAVNRPPVLAPIGDRSVRAGELLQVMVTAQDPDGDALLLEALDLPAGAALNDNGDATGVLEWTPVADQVGNYEATVTARDSGSPPASDSEVLTIRVERAAGDPPTEPPMVYDLSLRARWWLWGRWLYIRGGTLVPGTRVSLVEGTSGAQIAEVTASLDGSFRARLRPAVVPCTVQALAEGHASRPVAVRSAPASCGSPQLDVKAEWDDEDGALEVKGDGVPAFAVIEVYDADTGALIGSTRADASGEFEYSGQLSHAPTRVRITVNGAEVGVASVEDDEDD